MFFKTRKITDAEKLDAILEYLKKEQTRWQLSASPTASPEHQSKVAARLEYLEEQIALTAAYRAVEEINPHKK